MIVILATIALLFLSPTRTHLAIATGASPRIVLPLQACGVLDRSNATYVLEKDVSSAGTCFSIQADNIMLDLNKHTVTYAVSSGGKPTFGVLSADCWDKSIASNPCGGSHRHIVIMNGNIMQGPAAAPFSHAVRIGQASNLTGVTIHGLNITIAAEDSIGIYANILPGGSDVYDNTIHNNVKVISNRYQFRGASIKLDDEKDAKLPDLIHHNTIIGGAQLGIRSDNPSGTKIYDNDIMQDATYANGFCIDAAGNGMQVFHNYCHPVHGRGIHADHSGVRLFDNIVETTDSNQIQEYNGCEIHGTYGIQVESNDFSPTNVRVYGNHVIVHAAQCPAAAMRLTDIKGGDVQIYNNTFIAVQDQTSGVYSTAVAHGLSVGDVQGSHLLFSNNTVRADTSIFYIDWDSGGQIKLSNDTFQAGHLGQATLLADFESGVGPAQNNYFVDDAFQGFSPEAAKFGTYAGDSWYEVVNSIHLNVTGKGGLATPDLGGIASGGSQATQIQGVTDGQGNITFLLPALRIENQKHPLFYGDYRITLSAQGCLADAFAMHSETEQTLARQFSCNERH